MMTPDVRERLNAFGRELSPALIGGTSQMFAQMFEGMDPQTIEEPDIGSIIEALIRKKEE